MPSENHALRKSYRRIEPSARTKLKLGELLGLLGREEVSTKDIDPDLIMDCDSSMPSLVVLAGAPRVEQHST